MPSVFLGMFFLVFFLVLGTILLHLVRGISQWSRNNNSPRLTVPATVVAKRSDVSHHHHQDANGIGHTSSSTTYGDRMELCVGGSEYGMLAEGDFGDLTFQGTRYLGFERRA